MDEQDSYAVIFFIFMSSLHYIAFTMWILSIHPTLTHKTFNRIYTPNYTVIDLGDSGCGVDRGHIQ